MITVIVLLILAGAAVSIGLNGEDVFSKANDAKTEWNSKVAEEDVVNDYVSNLEEYIGKQPELKVVNKVKIIAGVGKEIEFMHKNNQTWYEWAIDAENSDDINVSVYSESPKRYIKDIIVNIYNTNPSGVISWTGNERSFTIMGDFRRVDTNTYVKANEIIQPGIYYIESEIM